MEKELNEMERLIVDLEWEIDTRRIAFSRFLALGEEELAAREDSLIREMSDDLIQLYGRSELHRRLA